MKQKLLLFTLLISFVSWGKTATANPSIGLLLRSYNQGSFILFEFTIKNTGEENLTNIYLTETPSTMPITYESAPIASLSPGETAIVYGHRDWVGCYDQSQAIVHATTASSTEITDLSADLNDYHNNGTYYNDSVTVTDYYGGAFETLFAQENSFYNDSNGNSIVDVGDTIYYFYNYSNGVLFDDNAEILSTDCVGLNCNSYGIHYLTPADVALGFVYNNSSVFIEVGNPFSPCYYSFSIPFNNQNSCFCPNPGNANIVTALLPVLPNQISGKVKYNTNSDNCATGSNFANRRISTTNGTNEYASYTNSTGDYHILIPNSGSFTTSALTNLSADFSSNPNSVAVSSSGAGINYNNTDFCIGSTTNYTDLNVNMFNINQAMPGNTATYRICYSNAGSTVLNGDIQLTYDNGKLTLAGTYPVQNSATANTLTWNYSNLLPFETRYIFLNMNVAIPPAVNTNDLLNFTLNGTPLVGDNVPANNSLTWNQIVRSSFDPNDKTVIEGEAISLPQASNYLTYVTRFQNTGTANATTVVIKDYLDPKLDWDTFEPIASSHASNIQIQNGGDVTYTFSNIDLAYESSDEAASHGWIAYRIKPKNNVAVGDIMSSSSNIYFDYNLPITTNTATTEIIELATTDFVKSNFAVFPNPASNYLIIKAETDMEASYEIFDINGKLLLNDSVESMNPININQLQSGFYFVNIKTNQGKATYKFIKN